MQKHKQGRGNNIISAPVFTSALICWPVATMEPANYCNNCDGSESFRFAATFLKASCTFKLETIS